ncbi:uncharacterized protein LOC142172421 [Nicotiana tabacum]|uniref:Uncharacterized protein LOC142172421 n=1 Tax=Nicotiana tabacum TaxID=4097 RepID=A0AC58T4H1_TOBAC
MGCHQEKQQRRRKMKRTENLLLLGIKRKLYKQTLIFLSMIKLLNWNIRGMKSQAASEKLVYLIKYHKVSFVAIQEPFMHDTTIDFYKNMMGMHGNFVNISNKIWVFWRYDLNCNVFANHEQLVTCKITRSNPGKDIFISVVYEKSKAVGREYLWEYMRVFDSTISNPWVVIGDFNNILSIDEKLGGTPHKLSKSLPFIECLQDCNLVDMGYTGQAFTWCNEIKERDILWKILDRLVANDEWDACFSKTTIQHLTRINSDHCPLLITAENDVDNYIKYFKFLNFWVDQHNFIDIVRQI